MSESEHKIIDVNKNRFHAIYITDDVIPRVLRCLDPKFKKSAVEKIESQATSEV